MRLWILRRNGLRAVIEPPQASFRHIQERPLTTSRRIITKAMKDRCKCGAWSALDHETCPKCGVSIEDPPFFLTVWQEWERRTGNTESKIEMHSDGSGEFTERDLYGPKHAFDSLEQLAEILKP